MLEYAGLHWPLFTSFRPVKCVKKEKKCHPKCQAEIETLIKWHCVIHKMCGCHRRLPWLPCYLRRHFSSFTQAEQTADALFTPH